MRIKELDDWRASDIHEGDRIDEAAFKQPMRAALAMNLERWK